MGEKPIRSRRCKGRVTTRQQNSFYPYTEAVSCVSHCDKREDLVAMEIPESEDLPFCIKLCSYGRWLYIRVRFLEAGVLFGLFVTKSFGIED